MAKRRKRPKGGPQQRRIKQAMKSLRKTKTKLAGMKLRPALLGILARRGVRRGAKKPPNPYTVTYSVYSKYHVVV
jgi:hypothetical protein